MGLVKTRRLAAMHPPSPRLRRTRKQQRAIHLRQGFHLRQGYGERVGGLKAAMKPPMKGGAGKGVARQFASAPQALPKAF